MAAVYSTDGGCIELLEGDEITGNIPVSHIYWYSKGATVGDDLLIEDTAGKTIFPDVANEENYSRLFPLRRKLVGIKATTIDSGRLFIYLDKSISTI